MLHWSDNLVVVSVDSLPTPRGLARGVVNNRCPTWASLVGMAAAMLNDSKPIPEVSHERESPEVTSVFIKEFGALGTQQQDRACEWHRMGNPKGVLAQAVSILRSHAASRQDAVVALVSKLSSKGFHNRDVSAILEFLLQPIEVEVNYPSGQLTLMNGSHRYCALESQGLGQELIVARFI